MTDWPDPIRLKATQLPFDRENSEPTAGAGMPDLLDGPPRHLERHAPPWAAARRTICGHPLDDVGAWLTYEQGRRLVGKYGQQRARLVLCQTCLNQQRAVKNAQGWEENPAVVVADYAQRASWGPQREEIRAELLALARLVEAHRDEYDAIVTAYQTDELSARRKAGR